MLNPEEVRRVANQRLNVGLVAASPAVYAEMEDFLLPASVSHERRIDAMGQIHRAGDRGAPPRSELALYDPAMPCPNGSFVFRRDDPSRTVREVLVAREELGLPLARLFPAFRRPVADHVVGAIARENALFALATALPNIIPNIIELPWAVSEFASDTAFLTINQIRMALLIAAACGRPVGFSEQKKEVASILAGAFGWRTLARELAGKIPFGGGLLPKGAIAYAGTYVVGKGLIHLNQLGRLFNGAERKQLYLEGLQRGHDVVKGELDSPG
jgi:hypothetical protein